MQPKILHIDVENGWRGGQQQAYYLFTGELKRNINSYLACKRNSKFHKKLKKIDLPHFAVDYKNELDIFSAKKIAKFTNEKDINIIVCHSSHSLSLGLLTKLFNHSLKLIAVRRVDFQISNNFISRWKYNTPMLDKIVCISNNIKQIMGTKIRDKDKLVVIKSGVDLNRFDNSDGNIVKKEFNLKDKFIVGTVAAFVGHKDYVTFIKAAKYVLQHRKNVVFIAVGDGELLNDIEKLSMDLEIYNHIIFTGFRNDVGNFLKAFDVFLFTSNMEGLGTSVLDAMTLGLPVVATKAGGIPEMIINDSNGYLCNIEDYRCLGESVIRLIDNSSIRLKFKKNSKILVEEFNINNTIEKYLNLYDSLLNG